MASIVASFELCDTVKDNNSSRDRNCIKYKVISRGRYAYLKKKKNYFPYLLIFKHFFAKHLNLLCEGFMLLGDEGGGTREVCYGEEKNSFTFVAWRKSKCGNNWLFSK